MKIMEPDEGTLQRRCVCEMAGTTVLCLGEHGVDEELNDFANEVAVLRDCSHVNIVNYVGAYKKGAEIFVSTAACRAASARHRAQSLLDLNGIL
jgi:hypothetical protein